MMKKIICWLKGHDLYAKAYDDWSDDKGRFVAGITVRCKRCKDLIWTAPTGYIKKLLSL